ncbi:MAG: GNAT family N-acetyltransferase [Oscillospiraceae bacterium]|nr:GNAT family N-acetyltransferase [Oscillospiraceae bacterium]
MHDIYTERLVLTPLTTAYLDTAHEYMSDPEICRLMVYMPTSTLEETLYFLIDAENELKKDEPSYYELAVLYNDIHIGAVSLYLHKNRTSCDLGWIFRKKYHGKGFATEAARAAANFAVNELGVHHFTAHCDTENTASRRVMEKLGMVLTDEHGGRKNKLSDEERREYLFEMDVN